MTKASVLAAMPRLAWLLADIDIEEAVRAAKELLAISLNLYRKATA
jgi:hypothetical protein